MAALWLKFILCSTFILIFGFRLSRSADEIVKAGRLSEGLMGVFILAAITSYPELWTSIASVTTVDAIDLGIGDLIGSVIFNLMIIAILDFKFGTRAILSAVKKDNLITCGLSLSMLGLLLASIILGGCRIGIFNIGIENFILISVYAIGIIYVYKHAYREPAPSKGPSANLTKKYIAFAASAGAIIACGFWLASLGKSIVGLHGWNEMYFGTIVVAFTTSLPEIVVCIAAVSIGSENMAIANVLGSNLFNMAIIPMMDILLKKGYILDYISHSHLYSLSSAIVLTLIVFLSMLYSPKKTFVRLGIGPIMLIFVFIISNLILFKIIT